MPVNVTIECLPCGPWRGFVPYWRTDERSLTNLPKINSEWYCALGKWGVPYTYKEPKQNGTYTINGLNGLASEEVRQPAAWRREQSPFGRVVARRRQKEQAVVLLEVEKALRRALAGSSGNAPVASRLGRSPSTVSGDTRSLPWWLPELRWPPTGYWWGGFSMLRLFLREEQGATMVEYAIMVALDRRRLHRHCCRQSARATSNLFASLVEFRPRWTPPEAQKEVKGRVLEMFKRFFSEEDGATMVEYGVMVALIAAVCVTDRWHVRRAGLTPRSRPFPPTLP